MRAINYLKFIILFLSTDLNAQSFEKSLIENRNIIPYPFNENNAYFNSTLDVIYFNSSKNLNNVGGISDLNDIWLRKKTENIWGIPININEINTSANDLLLGVDEEFLYVLTGNSLTYFSTDAPYNKIKEEEINGFNNNYSIISGSISKNKDIIHLSFDGIGSFGVEDLYEISKEGDKWNRPKSIGSSVNSEFQEMSPFLMNDTLIFISNRSSDGYKFYYTTKDSTSNNWKDPIKLSSLNTTSSVVSLSYNDISNSFLVSKSNDSKTYSDIVEYQKSKQNYYTIEFIFKEDISGNISVYNNNVVSEILPINNGASLFKTLNNENVRFKFITDSYFIKDTIISVSENKRILINLSKIEPGNREIQSNLIFEKSSTKLTDKSFPYLNDLLHIFKNNINLKITVEGHTDNSGSLKNNIRLSKERAEFIKGFLVKNGIKKGQIKVKGYGPTRPKFSNDSEELRVKNRRVEIYIN